MAREFTLGFYKTSAWAKCRRAFISQRIGIDGGMCQDCKEKPGKIVHHIVEIDENNINDPDVTLNMSNLKYVCQNCHNLIEHGFERNKVADRIEYTFDPYGNPVPLQQRGGKGNGNKVEEEY